jgi:AcrR family transcriptional regulator
MDKRQALIDAAATLAHQHGFGATTLAMVAEESGVPLGNVYYYFKTKEALADAVLDLRMCEMDEMLEGFARAGDARDQLRALLRGMRRSSEEISRSGCPFGRVSQDVGGVAGASKAVPVARMTVWCEMRMKALGLSRAGARSAALHLVSALQGASLLAWVHHDPKLLQRETRTLEAWVAGL